MTDSRCADCVHMAEWPERVAFVRENMQTVPETYPTLACMQCPTKALAVSPDDGGDCRHFERGDRDEYIREANHGRA